MKRDELAAHLSGTPGHGTLRAWAREILERAAGPGVAAVHHPLGFVCLPVERDGGEGVCLHLWTSVLPAATPTTSAIHCHSWELVSYVLFGAVGNRLPELAPDGRPTHRLFEVTSGPDGDELRPTGRTVRHAAGTAERFGTGAVYRLPAGVFHESVVAADAATIALGAERPGRPNLSLGPLGAAAHRVARRPCEGAALRAVARAALAGLSG
ncbi:hypothetical protein BTM25_25440 [Actinomadura rubteroloni]|uniref:Cysteine dioxygenase n=1 Tax=Actinomadura rubteroloni TaxID=1926885 RepID=A0A2P4UFY4_9ACTN|nr:hypothetical protein [Actinomadura rubteroloni]POM23918.1 hypothetical protein BTM25_25440 [Actinomadura rubteroloni]